jgi:AraC family transcriptional regulator
MTDPRHPGATVFDIAADSSYPAAHSPASGFVAPPLHLYAFDAEVRYTEATPPYTYPAVHQHALSFAVSGHPRVGGVLDREIPPRLTNPGEIVLVPAGWSSEWRSTGYYRNLILCVDPIQLSECALQAGDIDPARIEVIPGLFFKDELIVQAGLAVRAAMSQPGIGDLLYVESLGHTLAAHLLRHYVAVPAALPRLAGRLSGPILKRVLDYVAEHPNMDLTLAHLADLAHLSPYHFARLFKESMGQTVHEYVTEQRLRMSYHLLLGGDLPLAAIAAEAGFADQSHFVRRFKQLFGVTPGALRKDRKNIP